MLIVNSIIVNRENNSHSHLLHPRIYMWAYGNYYCPEDVQSISYNDFMFNIMFVEVELFCFRGTRCGWVQYTHQVTWNASLQLDL